MSKKNLKFEKNEKYICDGTEIKISYKNCKDVINYSGKNKQYSHNLILILNQKTKKISYWKLFPGSVHDKTALEYLINKKNINKDTNIYLDKGFTGIDKILPNAKIPKKIYKNKEFSALDKKNNYKINSIRSLIERIICILKNKSYILKYICRFGFKYLTKIIDFFIMNYNYEISCKKK